MADAGGAPIAHGIDLTPVDRIGRMIEVHGGRFLARVYTPLEQADAAAQGRPGSRRYVEFLAGRFAAKEAVLKAIGCGWSGGVAWTDVSIERQTVHGVAGRPAVRLAGRAAELAEREGIGGWLLSITHAGGFAQASAIGLRRG